MIDWPEQLINDLRRQKVAVVIGSGVSANSTGQEGKRPPLWEPMLKVALDRVGATGTRHIKQAINGKDYLHACEWLKDQLDENWVAFLEENFWTPQYKPAEIHKQLFLLDQKVFLSLNFDTIFEDFVVHETDNLVNIANFFDDDAHTFLRSEKLSIVKVHGSITSPNKLIFTQNEYAEARIKYSAFYEALSALILSHTILFVGCGTADPDLNLLLENHNFSFPAARPHYFITSEKLSPAMEKSLRKNRNLKCIRYKSDDGHSELTESLSDLAERLAVVEA